eukprot:748417-Hanusia_phi.AAC.6
MAVQDLRHLFSDMSRTWASLTLETSLFLQSQTFNVLSSLPLQIVRDWAAKVSADTALGLLAERLDVVSESMCAPAGVNSPMLPCTLLPTAMI